MNRFDINRKSKENKSSKKGYQTHMRKDLKKISSVLITLLLILSLFAGCGTATPSGDTNGSSGDINLNSNSRSGTNSNLSQNPESNLPKGTYVQIKMDDAIRMMESEDDYVILDVRTEAEFSEGHIPGAICIPNEDIQAINIQVDESDKSLIEDSLSVRGLSDKNQIILVYCRSGNRSKQAAQKLADMGYTQVYEFGGIRDWPGEIVK